MPLTAKQIEAKIHVLENAIGALTQELKDQNLATNGLRQKLDRATKQNKVLQLALSTVFSSFNADTQKVILKNVSKKTTSVSDQTAVTKALQNT